MTGPAHHLRYDPASRCRPVAEWPVADQQAWAAALRPALRMRDRPGALSHLRLPSRSLIEKAYGRWLTWLGEPVASEGSATAAATALSLGGAAIAATLNNPAPASPPATRATQEKRLRITQSPINSNRSPRIAPAPNKVSSG